MDTDPPSAERNPDAGLPAAEQAPHGAIDYEKYLRLMESLLRKFSKPGPFDLTFSIHKGAAQPDDPEAPEYVVDLSGADADLLLEKNATLLQAIEYVVLKAIRLDEEHFRKIAFDCQDWQQMRREELRLMAQVAADRVVDTGDPFTLNPMNPRERRVIHMALKNRPEVRTQSEGFGHERQVVIFPAK